MSQFPQMLYAEGKDGTPLFNSDTVYVVVNDEAERKEKLDEGWRAELQKPERKNNAKRDGK